MPEFNVGNGEGVKCTNCYAKLGSELVVELAFDGLTVNHFKFTIGGGFLYSYTVTVDNPVFPLFFKESADDLEKKVPPAMKITPNIKIPIAGILSLSLNGRLDVRLAGLGSALGKASANGGFGVTGNVGVAYDKPSPNEPGAFKFVQDFSSTFVPSTLNMTKFSTDGLMFDLKLLPKVLLGLTGAHFPFDLISVTSMLQVAPYLGYEEKLGKNKLVLHDTDRNEN